MRIPALDPLEADQSVTKYHIVNDYPVLSGDIICRGLQGCALSRLVQKRKHNPIHIFLAGGPGSGLENRCLY